MLTVTHLFYQLTSDDGNLVIKKLTEWFILLNAKHFTVKPVHIERKRNSE